MIGLILIFGCVDVVVVVGNNDEDEDEEDELRLIFRCVDSLPQISSKEDTGNEFELEDELDEEEEEEEKRVEPFLIICSDDSRTTFGVFCDLPRPLLNVAVDVDFFCLFELEEEEEEEELIL